MIDSSITLHYNDQALKDSPYHVFEKKSLNGRIICRYILDNQQSNALDRAAEAIVKLLRDNKILCETFTIEPLHSLATEIGKKFYLIINDKAVSLSIERNFPFDAQLVYKDYFTGILLKEPVKCTQGHHLEKSLAQIWKQKKDTCPAGEHPIGDLVVDQELQENIKNYLEQKKEKEQKDQDFVNSHNLLQLTTFVQQQQITALAAHKKLDPYLMASVLPKLILKLGVLHISFFTAKYLVKESSKKVVEAVAKKIPYVCLVFGLGMGLYRFNKGKKGRGIGEIASGIANLIPGIGTVISVAIDTSLASYDVYEIKNQCLVINLKLEEAYKYFGLNPETNYTEHDVDSVFYKRSLLLHPDKIRSLMTNFGTNYTEELFNELTRTLNSSKELIYKSKGWS